LMWGFYDLKESREAAAHHESEADERLDYASSKANALMKVVIALKRPRFQALISKYLTRPVPHGPPAAPMTEEEHRVLDPLWDKRPDLLLVGGLLPIVRHMKVLETQQMLDSLAAYVGEAGELNEAE